MSQTIEQIYAQRLGDYLASPQCILYEHQNPIGGAIVTDLQKGNSGGVIKEPTGIGKTILIGTAIEAIDEASLVLVPKKSTANNTRNEFENVLGMDPNDIGVYHSDIDIDDREAAIGKKILITTPASFTSLVRRGKVDPTRFKYVSLDECHKMRGDVTSRAIKDHLIDTSVVHAWSATDTFLEGPTVGEALFGREDRIHETLIADAIEAGWLSNVKNIIIKTRVDFKEARADKNLTEKQQRALASRVGRDEQAISMSANHVDSDTGTIFSEQPSTVKNIYDLDSSKFISNEKVKLPVNPENNHPIIFTPKRWLRFNPWLNYDDYFKSYCPKDELVNPEQKLEKITVLNYNRDNYGVIKDYIEAKERKAADCKNDPLFKQIPVTSAKTKMAEIKKLNTGKKDKADQRYEDLVCQLMASLMYPELDFAEEQSRTDSGVLIRDMIFYNNRESEFLKDIFDDYDSKQIVMEIKNVKELDNTHVNQLNRYMTDSLGKFGIMITRNPLTKARMKNTIDLWSGQRRSIIVLTDLDLEQMVEVFDSKQRLPIDVVKKKYIEFKRECPS